MQWNADSPENPFLIPICSIKLIAIAAKGCACRAPKPLFAMRLSILQCVGWLVVYWQHFGSCKMSTTGTHRLYACMHTLNYRIVFNIIWFGMILSDNRCHRWNWENTEPPIIYSFSHVFLMWTMNTYRAHVLTCCSTSSFVLHTPFSSLKMLIS